MEEDQHDDGVDQRVVKEEQRPPRHRIDQTKPIGSIKDRSKHLSMGKGTKIIRIRPSLDNTHRNKEIAIHIKGKSWAYHALQGFYLRPIMKH